MDIWDYLIIIAIAAWFAVAVVRLFRGGGHGGCCGGGCSGGCEGCGKSCPHRKP